MTGVFARKIGCMREGRADPMDNYQFASIWFLRWLKLQFVRAGEEEILKSGTREGSLMFTSSWEKGAGEERENEEAFSVMTRPCLGFRKSLAAAESSRGFPKSPAPCRSSCVGAAVLFEEERDWDCCGFRLHIPTPYFCKHDFFLWRSVLVSHILGQAANSSCFLGPPSIRTPI